MSAAADRDLRDIHQQILGSVNLSESSAGIMMDCVDSFTRIIFANQRGDRDMVSEIARIELAHLRYALNATEVEPPERPA